ncbi:Penicillin-binding protein 1A [Serratia symbiotica]|nr:Penicillin-binding protein 1A [Serratia symbiotica]
MKFISYVLNFIIYCIILVIFSIFILYKYIEPQLPNILTLKDIKLQIPMQIFSADNKLIAQYGDKRRIPLKLNQIPSMMIQAFLATEDNRFYEHHGIDPIGMFRAIYIAIISGHVSQGASTITQQLARNFFLNSDRTLIRKIKEIFLAFRIELILSKNNILELYLNKIYLGYHAYGIGAAAQVYFGKNINQLSLSEIATIAGLPKAPSTFNPIYSNYRATVRRNIVLKRMLNKHYITEIQYNQACNENIISYYHAPEIDFYAPYISEMVRQQMVTNYGNNAYNDGYKIYTTITKKLQIAAQQAVYNNIMNYDMRHGYRGASKLLWKIGKKSWNKEKIINILKKLPTYGSLVPAIITHSYTNKAIAMLVDGSNIILPISTMYWARPYISDTEQGETPKRVTDVVVEGHQIWVRKINNNWWLSQIPEVNSALISINPNNGEIKALVGGFNFNQSNFNRVTQAQRQVGSNIKPFIYSAALNKGMTLATILNDLPITRWDLSSGTSWKPKNSPPIYIGPIRLRQGLGQSKNSVIVRIIRAIGVDYAAEYLKRFGFPSKNISHTESLALGSTSLTPMQVVRGYAVLANGGYLINPYFINKIEDNNGNILFLTKPKEKYNNNNIQEIHNNTQNSEQLFNNEIENSFIIKEKINKNILHTSSENINFLKKSNKEYIKQVISNQLAFLIYDALNSNIYGESGWIGTAWRSRYSLKRNDIGGKTGTTNNSRDAWFSGYGPNIVTSIWIGFDNYHRTLGRSTNSGFIKNQISGTECGAKSAQPAWDDFMKYALKDTPEQKITPPIGIISVTIDKLTGKLSNINNDSRIEYFIEGTQPTDYPSNDTGITLIDSTGKRYELF